MTRNKYVLLAAIAALSLSLFSAGCRKLEARDNLNKGVQAFKGAKYAEAVEFFKTAIELDPEYPTARLYLATAYMSQYIPGAESPENLAFAKNALDNFELVLKDDPQNATAVESIASLFYLQAQGTPKLEDKIERLGEAEKWYKRLTEVEPSRKEAWYSLGVIAWAKWYPVWMEARTKAGMKPEAPGPLKDRKVREELNEKYGPMINEGVANLQKALDIDAEYDDAMAYMNLLIRERADLADTQAGHDADIDTADMWMQKALETRKMKAERQPGASGISME
jgi:tetratricopeptide (TPR) repeat protein